ncbi:MAG: DUF523 domain-containing protein [Campylobacterota bacterium]|nr:DUF523 domain-containing protein [Campylobacterota bacterium]
MSSRKKIIISACLLGEACRYDGKSKPALHVSEKYKGYEIIPFCPEAPVLGTPRGRISVIEMPNGALHVKSDENGRDVTQHLKFEVLRFLKEHSDVKKAVLKSKSPSCGFGTTPILNTKHEQIALGNGIAAQMLHDRGLHVSSELNI